MENVKCGFKKNIRVCGKLNFIYENFIWIVYLYDDIFISFQGIFKRTSYYFRITWKIQIFFTNVSRP